jgi:ATP-binding cassette subfamily B protein
MAAFLEGAEVRVNITTSQVLSYVTNKTKPFPASIFVMVWIAIVWSISISLMPYLLKSIVDRLIASPQANVFIALGVPIILYLGMHFLLHNSFRLYDYFVAIKMIPRMRKNIANDALDMLIDKTHTYYQNNFSGSLTNKINDLANSVPDILQITIDRFFSHTLALIIAIITLWQVNILFSSFMLIQTVLFIVGALIFSKRLTRLADNWSEHGSIITGKITDVLSNILSVRLFTAKNYEKRSLNKTFQGAVTAEEKLQWSYFWMWLCYGLSAFAVHAFSFYFLCKGRQEGWVTIGDFVLVLGINNAVFDFLWQVAKEFSQFSKLYGKITQALRSILDKPEIVDKIDAKSLIVSKGQITFESVKFHYKGTEPLFQNKSITIEAGQKVGLVGYSGGGKSTFVNLILRLYEVTDGHIYIDGQNIRDVTQDSLRSNIAMIPQDPSLFHRTLRENIHYGRIEATDEEVIGAAKKAHAHEFISQLHDGYESLVGERGVKLSGGQRQRIAIARAILKNAPILILDEATSQLDSVTESNIQESLWELMQDKTTIVIAHRLSTLLHMDRIIVFDQGKIIEDGTHTELLRSNGLYKTLWEAQVGGFLPDKKNEIEKNL